ncbi:MAG TPA: cytochrome c peroxidase [Kofleriaceae bacterium]
MAIGLCGCGVTTPTKEQVGQSLFEDPNLSSPAGTACSSCHDPKQAFREPESDFATSMGAVKGRFGPRNTQTAMYARYVPPLQFDEARGAWIGGLFHDGRASTLEEQAEKPLLNPLEMNNANKAAVVATVREASYAASFTAVFGPRALDDADAGFAHVTEAIAAYERTAQFAPFASKYDAYLAHRVELSAAEARGLAIFEDPARGNCATCHPSRPAADGTPPLFTTYGYANLGIPKYMNNPFFADEPAMNPDGAAYIDHGLMETVADPAQDGKFRIPTLRNVARTPPYGHAGYFENLPYVLEFIATRDGYGPNGAWPGPEVAATVDQRVGHLPLTNADLDDLRAFLVTLNDP